MRPASVNSTKTGSSVTHGGCSVETERVCGEVVNGAQFESRGACWKALRCSPSEQRHRLLPRVRTRVHAQGLLEIKDSHLP